MKPTCIFISRLSAFAAMLAVGVLPVGARDVYVMLSGGASPLSNNYSQYVQAKNMIQFFRSRYPANSVWLFFGAGNRPGQPVALADAYRKIKRDDGKGNQILIDSWEPGYLEGNRPATREEFLGALKSEILPAVRDGGTLFLFVGDHGDETTTPPIESRITLWQMKPDKTTDHGWSQDRTQFENLTLSDLRAAIAAGIGKGKVVFCMTQCHSGGFNFLGVQRVPAVPSGWFTAPTQLATSWGPLVPAAGFTATDEQSLASGCDPDPDPDKWAGYERYIPECLLGLDLIRGTRISPGLRSFAEANVAATLEDKTIDKPRSTSEQYLQTWAALIQTKLESDPTLKPRIKADLEVYDRIVDGGAPTGIRNKPFLAHWNQLQKCIQALADNNPDTARLIRSGTAKEIDEAIGGPPGGFQAAAPRNPGAAPANGFNGWSGNRGNFNNPRAKIWVDELRPAWKKALDAGQVPGTAAQVEFEKQVIAAEEKPTGTDMTDNPRAMLNFEFWHSGYAFPDKATAGQAEQITQWAATRRQRIIDWAKASSDEHVRKAVEDWTARPQGMNDFIAGRGRRGRGGHGVNTVALERVRFYRQVMGAWAFLLAAKDRNGLKQLAMWQKLEDTPLPAPVPAARQS
jgi:hypothetical protein